MVEKLIVNFKELPVLPYNIDYLTYCKQCGTYNLGSKACVKCAKEEEISLDQLARETVLKQFVLREFILLMCYIGMFILARDFRQIALGTLLIAACMGLSALIYFRYKEVMILHELEGHITANVDKIRSDLMKQMGMAIQDVEDGNVVKAYDRFRYLAKLIDNDAVRTYKLICLRNFQLRSDMPLELSGLLQEEYNSYLIDYIYEVSKLKKELVDDATLSYFVKYKDEVQMKYKGKRMMASVLSGALKSKLLFSKYVEEMPGYLRYFPKDRLLRFCKMVGCIDDPALKNRLIQEVKEVVGENENFTGYL